ncbi:MAG: glycosyltransferase family 4 protein [Pyrinomonadaceae bacterium]
MNTYLTLFLVSLFSSLLLTPIVRRIAQRRGWLDVPQDGRRVHTAPIPRLGGVAVFCSVAAALAVLPFLDNLVTASLRENWRDVVAVFASSTLVFLFGVYDDRVGASAKWKFVAQGVAATLLYFLGGHIGAVTIPFVGSVAVPPVVGFLFTVVWVVGVSNAFNLIDGLDGLATGAALFASLVMFGTSLVQGHPMVTVVSIVLTGSLIGFLRYNFNPASIFLGDSGSLFVGFLLAALSVTGGQKASTAVAVAIPIMAFGLPVIDTGFTMARRFVSAKPLFEGDREHIHHKLLERGWSQRRVAFVLYGVCALFGMAALLFTSDGGTGRLTGLVLLVTGAAVVLIAGRLRYHEVDEVRASVMRNVTDRRARGANNIAIRRASHAMKSASTLGELLAALEQVLELGEFAHASAQLGRGGDADASARAIERSRGSRSLRGAEVSGTLVHWEWRRDEGAQLDVAGSELFWTLRLPLSTDDGAWGYVNFYKELTDEQLMLNVNYLSGFFRLEMARAAERAFGGAKEQTPEHERVYAGAVGAGG